MRLYVLTPTMSASRFAAWAGAPTAERVTGVIRVTERPPECFRGFGNSFWGNPRRGAGGYQGCRARPSMTEVTQVTQSTRPGGRKNPLPISVLTQVTWVTRQKGSAQRRRTPPPIQFGGALFSSSVQQFASSIAGALATKPSLHSVTRSSKGTIATALTVTRDAARPAVTNSVARLDSFSVTEPELDAIA